MNSPHVSRRFFVKQGALAFAAIGAGALFGPDFLRSSVLAAETRKSGGGKRVLVCLFQRGAADGLSMVVPYGDPDYYKLRRDIALAAPSQKAGVAGVLRAALPLPRRESGNPRSGFLTAPLRSR